MAWTQETTKIAGKDITIYKNSMYKITSIENSRDEFLIVSASAESQPKPEGKKEDDESKEG